MADYTKVADVGNEILELLRETLVPELLNSSDQIGLCSPEDHGDFAVGVWLYDVREDQGIQMHDMINIGANSQRYPSTYLLLRYMITLYLQSDLKYRAVQEQHITGKIIQMFRDNPLLDSETLKPGAEAEGLNIRIRMLDIPIEEKLRIWTVPNTAYRHSLFYEAGPVEIRSAKRREVRRVRSVEYRFTE